MEAGSIHWIEVLRALIHIWQIEGEKLKAVTDFLFSGSKITVDSDCSHEIRRQLLLGRKAMTNIDSLLKIKDITDKGQYSRGCGLSNSHIRL